MTHHLKILALEGNSQLLDGGAMFGNAPKEMWQKWIPADSKNRIRLSCRCLLVQYGSQNILFETGIGAFFEPALKERFGVESTEHILLQSLKKHELDHRDIHHVVLSHLHFDHAGGCLSAYEEGKELTLLFPHARFYVGKEHWERALKPHPRDRASFVPVLNKLLEQSGRLVLIDTSTPSLFPFLSFHFSSGHTPGLMLSEIQLDAGPLVFASDLIPGAAWVHVPISMGYDRFPELVIDEKQRLLEDLEQRQGMLFFTHDEHMAVGKICKKEKGKFIAEAVTNTDGLH
jgi:glyoxylase-like metal-dependent hydrolase (beta-lactamase superfamily II)